MSEAACGQAAVQHVYQAARSELGAGHCKSYLFLCPLRSKLPSGNTCPMQTRPAVRHIKCLPVNIGGWRRGAAHQKLRCHPVNRVGRQQEVRQSRSLTPTLLCACSNPQHGIWRKKTLVQAIFKQEQSSHQAHQAKVPTRLLLSLPASVAAAVAQQRARPRSVSLAVPHSVSSTLQTSGLVVGCWGLGGRNSNTLPESDARSQSWVAQVGPGRVVLLFVMRIQTSNSSPEALCLVSLSAP